MKKLLAITPYPYRSADTRYRICQYIPLLEQAGWRVTLRPFMSEPFFNMYDQQGRLVEKVLRTGLASLGRLSDCLNAQHYDAILLHKEAFPFGPPFMEKWMHARQPKIIYDMDDAFWTHPPQFRQIGGWLRDPKRIQKMISLSSHVLAGNPFLAAYARQFNSQVTIFPTVLDLNRYTLRQEIEDGVVTIGWVGRWSSESYLDTLLPVFRYLSKKYKNLQFRFVGAKAVHFPQVDNIEIVPWRLESEVEDITAFDIGIMPLADDIYSQGKCGFKLLQYMALGIPGIASPVGVNKDIVEDGVNGYLASSEHEWIDKLSLLIENPDLRRKIGLAARATVGKSYSLDKAFPALLGLLENLSGTK